MHTHHTHVRADRFGTLNADDVATAVWEIWTRNGLGMDTEERVQSAEDATAAVIATDDDGADLDGWINRALARLPRLPGA